MKRKIKEFIYKRYNISFSKSGDDIQLMKLINQSTPGTYVDIGCWHPVKASNTYFFYLRGWKGICIDPNPELKILYDKIRPKDVFVTCALGNNAGNLNYYMLNDNFSSMNTLNYDFLKSKKMEKEIKKTIKIPTRSLKMVLDDKVSINDRLDFFDIDAEGYDLEVLKSNDWSKYRAKIIVIETDIPLQGDVVSETTQYLEHVDYRLIGKSIISGDLGNLFYIDRKL